MIQKAQFDVVIRNGFIADGTGNPGYFGNLAINDDRIISIDSHIKGKGKHELDARGQVIAPGFIDPHEHAELTLLSRPTLKEFLSQGVTTVINGNCGHSIAPGSSGKVREYMYRNGLIPSMNDPEPHWDSFASYLEAIRLNGGTAINSACQLGYGTIRWAVMGEDQDRQPTPHEMDTIRACVARGLQEGAVGLSTGLAYIPNCFATTAEIIDVATIVSQYDGVYSSHIRYQIGIEEAVKEAIDIGRRARVRVQISHLAMNEQAVYSLVEGARREGVEVTVDTIPRSTGHVVRKDRLLQFLLATVPAYFNLDVDAAKADLATPDGQKRLRESKDPFFNMDKRQIALVNTIPQLEGKSVAQVAREKNMDPYDVMFDFLLDEELPVSFWFGRLRYEGQASYPAASVIGSPWLSVGGDILLINEDDPYGWYELLRQGGFPNFLKQAHRKGVRLEEVIRRLTALPAQTFRFWDRGLLRPGYKADVIIFDPDSFDLPNQDKLDYSRPLNRAVGLSSALVNGTLIWEDGALVEGIYPGAQLMRKELL